MKSRSHSEDHKLKQTLFDTWQQSVQWASSLVRSLMTGTFEQDHVGKAITLADPTPAVPTQMFGFTFTKQPTVSMPENCRIMVFADVLRLEIFNYRHSPGCLHSSSPELMVQDPDGSNKMIKTLYFKTCNGSFVNIEGLVLGMSTLGKLSVSEPYDRPAYEVRDLLRLQHLVNMGLANEEGMINRGFLARASAKTLNFRQRILAYNGLDYYLNVGPVMVRWDAVVP